MTKPNKKQKWTTSNSGTCVPRQSLCLFTVTAVVAAGPSRLLSWHPPKTAYSHVYSYSITRLSLPVPIYSIVPANSHPPPPTAEDKTAVAQMSVDVQVWCGLVVKVLLSMLRLLVLPLLLPAGPPLDYRYFLSEEVTPNQHHQATSKIILQLRSSETYHYRPGRCGTLSNLRLLIT